MFLRFSAFMTIVLSVSMLAHADELRQVISREHPAIQGTESGLAWIIHGYFGAATVRERMAST